MTTSRENPDAKDGRRKLAWSEAATLILDRVGPGRRIGSQAHLRAVAGVGSPQIKDLKLAPGSLPHHVIVRLADAVEVPVLDLFRAAGVAELDEAQLAEIRDDIQRRRESRELVGGVAHMSPTRFFEELRQRAQRNSVLLAASFTSPPLAASSEDAEDKLVAAIEAGVSFALCVPCAVEEATRGSRGRKLGTGTLAARYHKSYDATFDFASRLAQRLDEQLRRRIGLFALQAEKLPGDVLNFVSRIVLPAARSDERSCLAVVGDKSELLVARWSRVETGEQHLEVVHDDSSPKGKPRNEAIGEQWFDYFADQIVAWELSHKSGFAELDTRTLWVHVPLYTTKENP